MYEYCFDKEGVVVFWIMIPRSLVEVYQCFLEVEKKKVKESRNRPGVAQRVPGDLGSHIFMTFGT